VSVKDLMLAGAGALATGVTGLLVDAGAAVAPLHGISITDVTVSGFVLGVSIEVRSRRPRPLASSALLLSYAGEKQRGVCL
jgi:hypothetical protein